MPSPNLPIPAAFRCGLIALAVLSAACTKRSNCETENYIGNHVVLDSNRVLATAVRKTECDVDGFMVMTTESVYRSRFFLLDIRDPSPPRPLKAEAPTTIDGGFLEGGKVVLDPWKILNMRDGSIASSGFDARIMRKHTAEEYVASTGIGPGPRSGLYLISAVVHRRSFPETENGAWYLFDKAAKRYELLVDDSLGTILDLTYREGIPWALFRKDSLSVVHRPWGSDSGGFPVELPDTLTERSASVGYVGLPDSLWLRFACGHCPREERVKFRFLGSTADPWLASGTTRPYPALGPLLALEHADRKSMVLMRKSDFRDTAEFPLSDYLR